MENQQPRIIALRLDVDSSDPGAELRRIDDELHQKYALSCEHAGWLRRWYLRMKWKREREERLERLATRLPYFLSRGVSTIECVDAPQETEQSVS